MKSVVLLSGGLDSVVNLHMAHKSGKVQLALTFDYGQRAASQEIKAARLYCEKLGIKHQVIDISWLGKITRTALVDLSKSLPNLKNLDDKSEGDRSAVAVWVPNRNGVMLNIAASFAESLDCDVVVPGFNLEEATTFPDNSEDYMLALDKSFSLSTLKKVKVQCFTVKLNKVEIVKLARSEKIDLSGVWSCYQGGPKPCGVCESCQRFKRANDL